MAVDEYRLRCAELATMTARRDADLEAAEQSYVDDVDALADRVSSAEAVLSTVDGAMTAARKRLSRIDAEATALWHRAGELVGVRRLGALPAPALSTVDGEPRAALDRVEAELRRYRTGTTRVRLPRWFVALLPGLAAAGAVPPVIAGHALGATVAGLVLAPLPGLVTARALARRYGAWLDAGAVALTVLFGLVAGGVAVVVFGAIS
jgi:hypothetical protein